MKGVILFEVAGIDTNTYPLAEQWFKDNVNITYEDTDLEEDLYTIDFIENLMDGKFAELVPDHIKKFHTELLNLSPNVFYFRFQKA